jgi:hypothetical protein
MVKKTRPAKRSVTRIGRLEDKADDKRVASKQNSYSTSASVVIKRITPLDDESMPFLAEAKDRQN